MNKEEVLDRLSLLFFGIAIGFLSGAITLKFSAEWVVLLVVIIFLLVASYLGIKATSESTCYHRPRRQ